MPDEKRGLGPPQIDFDHYAKLLGNPDPNDPDVRAFIESLFNILVQIVDLSWGQAPSQIVSGQLNIILAETAEESADIVKLEDLSNHFEAAADAAE